MSDEAQKLFERMVDRVLNYKPPPKGKKSEKAAKKRKAKKSD